ncbi:MAG: hypothetical protein E1N59_2680 [Puniceicoccaceae bacterium 5H]|nr:MAG: hypothetical protein E1N59_2680 [Puniceicoccaceae bacterium 5H]
MSDSGKSKEKSLSSSLDLSSLDSLSLGPNWGSGSTPKVTIHTERSERDDRRKGGRGGPRREGGGRRDRRSFERAKGNADEGGSGGGRPPRGRGDRGDRRGDRGDRRQGGHREQRETFQPIVECTFYADDAPFKALTQAIRNSYRTFELFEIARLILEKPERYVCLVKHPDQRQGEEAKLVACVQDGLPFLSEQEALSHVFKNYLSDFFDTEEVEVEAPTGNFQVIHKCGMTGELLGPPNYHRYGALIQEHHAAKLAHVPFERFKNRIESVRDEDAVQQWIEQMKKAQRYTLKGQPEGEDPKTFLDLESARFYLVTHQKDKLVRPAYSARFLGKDLPLLPANDPIRRSVEALHEQQMRFPLDTANHLRGRLRRLNFAVYKKGSKGVSYVCAVKRRFRKPGEALADNLNDLITFIEAHPKITVKALPHEYLGIDLPEQKEGEALPEGAEQPAISDEDKEQLQGLKRDLRYLITQGYVIEYSDGSLFAPAPRDVDGSGNDDDNVSSRGGKRNRGNKPKAAQASPGPIEAATPAPTEAPQAEAEAQPAEQAAAVEATEATENPAPAPEAQQEEKAVASETSQTDASLPEQPVAEQPAAEEPAAITPETPAAPEAAETQPAAEEIAPEAPTAEQPEPQPESSEAEAPQAAEDKPEEEDSRKEGDQAVH